VRLGIQFDEKIMQRARHRILRGSELVQLGILQIEIRLTHRALHVGNGVAHHATQPGLRLGAMHNLLDRRVHQSAYSTAGSWHPPHHFDGLVPTVSCMYSIDLRYHWLLNEEKWCAELNHWL